jgi:predicted LPLAT superfamily acyltransferase
MVKAPVNPVLSAAAARRSTWLSVAERGSVFGITFFVWLSTAFGRAPARFVLRFVVLYYVLFHASLRRVSADYWLRVCGGVSFARIYAHVLRFAETALDRAFIVSGKHRYFRVTRTGSEHLQDLVARKRGAILLGAHLGSFEAMRVNADLHGFRINFLGYFKNARMLNAALGKIDPAATSRLIAIEPAQVDFVLRVKERIEQGECVAIMGDRVGADGRAVSVDFFGAKADFPTGPYLLASILKCPIYLTFGLYRAPDRYDLFCEPFDLTPNVPRGDRDEALRGYAQKFAARLEHFVRMAPDNWFNFYDFWRSP